MLPLVEQILLSVDRADRTDGHTGSATNACFRINIELLSHREICGLMEWMNGIHRTNIHTGSIFGSNTRFSNYISHESSSSRFYGHQGQHMNPVGGLAMTFVTDRRKTFHFPAGRLNSCFRAVRSGTMINLRRTSISP